MAIPGADTTAIKSVADSVQQAMSQQLGSMGGQAASLAAGAASQAQGALAGATGALSGLAGNASGALSGLASGAAGAVGGLAGSLQGSISNAISGVTGSLGGSLNSLMGGALSSLSGVAGASISKLASAFPDALSMFTSPSAKAATMTSISKDQGKKEADTKIESLASDAAAAIANPVAFVSKPVKDIMKGMDTMSKGAGVQDLMKGMSPSSLANLGSVVGSSIGSSSDVMGAINKVTNDLAGKIGGSNILGSITSGLSNTLGPITSGLNNFAGSLTSGIKSALGSVTSVASGIIQAGSDLANAALSVLPDPLRNVVSAVGTGYLSNMANDLLGNKLSSIQNVMGLLGNTSFAGSLIGNVAGLSSNASYNGYVNADGTWNTSVSSGNVSANNTNDIMALYDAAMTICNNIKAPSIYSYGNQKDLFDLLLQLAAQFGLTDLMKQLANCTGNDLFDSRSVETLRKSMGKVAYGGDSVLMSTITSIIGANNVLNPQQQLVTLNANMQGTRANVAAYNELLGQYNTSVPQLVSTNQIGKYNILSGGRVSVMSASNTQVIDGAIGRDTRALLQGATALFT